MCKLAIIADIEEQDYSLNPGRYVGVVIEEDGLTEEEFEETLLDYNSQLTELNKGSDALEKLISKNFKLLFENENS